MDLPGNNIFTRPFWGDEAWTVLISQLPLLDLVKTTAADFHPPLYYTIIHFWAAAFGSGEVATRTVSLIFWLLSGVAVYFFTRSLKFSSLYSLVSILLVLFNPFVFFYAFEARNYTLFVFLSLVSMWHFSEILKSNRPRFLSQFFYLLSSVAGLYTHYYMFFVVAAQYLYLLVFRRHLFSLFLKFSLLFLILYLPWLPFFLSQTRSVAGGYWIGKLTWETIGGALVVLVTGEQRTVFTNLLPVFFTIYLAVSARSKRLLTPETALFFFWLLVPFAIPIVISLVRPIFFYRYLVATSVPLMLLPLFWLSATKKLSFLPLVILAVYLYTAGVAFVSQTDPHFKPILAKIHREAKPEDVIYTLLPSFAEVVYYNNYDGRPLPIKVAPLGLSQASGRALLDTYVSKGYLTIAEPPKIGRYWYLEPGPKYALVDRRTR